MKTHKHLIVLLIILFNSTQLIASEYFGDYKGKVTTEWLKEGRTMKLLSDFTFTDPNGMTWAAPKNSIIDGASIPEFAWTIIGSPFVGKYRNASVIHDIACDEKTRTWESVHLAFYYAMRASGVGELKAKMMYAAVYHGGPRWSAIKPKKAPHKPKPEAAKTPITPTFTKNIPAELAIEREQILNILAEEEQIVIEQDITQNDLAALIDIIQNSEDSNTPLALENIRALK